MVKIYVIFYATFDLKNKSEILYPFPSFFIIFFFLQLTRDNQFFLFLEKGIVFIIILNELKN